MLTQIPLSKSFKRLFYPIAKKLIGKYAFELDYWQEQYKKEKENFSRPEYYRRLMLAMAQENDEKFLQNKIIADFGCGPRGSLSWANNCSIKIGIDVLADRYADFFPNEILSHRMFYIRSTERIIPIPSNSIDIMFSLNAMDHVDDFKIICNEIIRVIKPGGEFIGSFNLNEPYTLCEPQTLTERIIKKDLLSFLKVNSYRITNQGDGYEPFFKRNLSYSDGFPAFLWVRAQKPIDN